MSRGSRGYEAGEVCNDLAHIYGDNPLPCHHSGRFFSLIPLGHYIAKARLEKLGEHAMVSYDKFAKSYSMHADVRAAAVTRSSKQGLSQNESRSGFGLFARTRLCQHL